MKQIISVGAEKSCKVSQQEMEYQLDHCSAPWLCPIVCCKARIGCLQKKFGGE